MGENDFTDDDGREADDDRTGTHTDIRILRGLADEGAGQAAEDVRDDEAEQLRMVRIYAEGPDHILVVTRCTQCRTELGTEKPVENGDQCDRDDESDDQRRLRLGDAELIHPEGDVGRNLIHRLIRLIRHDPEIDGPE